MDEKPDSALAVLNGINNDNLNHKALEAHYEFVWWNAKMKYNIPPDLESTRIAYDYYTNRGASSERFLCHLYRGIYYLYQDDCESAMLEFSKAEEDYDLASYAMQGLLHTYKDVVYNIYFDYDNRISQLKAAADRYLKGNIYSRYVESVIDIMDCYIMQDDAVNSATYIALAEDYLEYADEWALHSFSISKAKFLKSVNKTTELLEFLDEYIKNMSDSPSMQWRILAHLYNYAGAHDKALSCIEKEAEMNDISEDPNYYAVLAGIKEGLKEYEGAIEAHKKAAHLDDSLEVIKLNRHVQLYSDALAERDILNDIVEKSSIREKTRQVISDRLEVLNKVIISHITDTSRDNRKAYEELEALISDRASFLESTRKTIENINPDFVAYLVSKGLTEDEVNLCCLYVIGMKGKDIKDYTAVASIYKDSSAIRHKLGLMENDTNLSNFLQDLLKRPSGKLL